MRFKYVRVLVNQKEDRKQKSFLEKYKDSIGTIASLCAVATVFIAVIMTMIRDRNSYFAEEFYHIDKTYFLQESIMAIWSMAIAEVIAILLIVLFPTAIAFLLENPEQSVIANKKEQRKEVNIFRLGHTLCYIIYVTFVLRIVVLKLNEGIFNQIFFVILLIIVCIISCFALKGISDIDKENKIKIRNFHIIIFHFILLVITWIFLNKCPWMKILLSFYMLLIYYRISCLWIRYRDKKNKKIENLYGISVIIIIFIFFTFQLPNLSIGMIKNYYYDKKDYEIVQKISAYDLERVEEQTKDDTKDHDAQKNIESPLCRNEQNNDESPFQVVILHRGSQVLLMNGKIDGNETINPQEDMSSSNLVIDTSSYEFQEANQYRFYRKEFKNVTPDPPPQK